MNLSRFLVTAFCLFFAPGIQASFAGVYFDLGKPVVGAWQRKAWVVPDPVLKKELLWSQESSQEGAILYAVDLASGKVIEEHEIPAREIGGILPAGLGVLYLYTYSGLNHPGNEVLRFDPSKRRIERLGLADIPRNRCVDGVIGSDGNVYIGTHQEGRLFRLDTKKTLWADLGPMVPATLRTRPNIWLRNLHLTSTGKILAAVVASPPPIVVEINPKDGSFQTIAALQSEKFMVYKDRILVPTLAGISVFDPGYRKVQEITAKSLGLAEPLILAAADSNWGILLRSGNNLLRLDDVKGNNPSRLKLPHSGSFCLAADQRVVVVNHPLRRFSILDMKKGETATRAIGYAGKRGTQVCGLNRASDGSIYGTNIIGMHLFRHDPKNGTTRDLGHVGWPGGEVYNVIDVDGKIYFGTYGGGYWGVYDPKKPWKPDFAGEGTAADANPRKIAQLGGDDPQAVNRPFEYVYLPSPGEGKGGKIYIAARANYGHPGGSLVEFDPRTQARRVFRDLKRSVQTVTADGRFIYGGTSKHGGRGSEELADDGTLFIFDPQSGNKIFEEAVVPGARAVVCVRYNPKDKLVYATTDNQVLLAFDPVQRKVLKSWRLANPGTPLAGVPEDVGMIHITPAADGNIYGITRRDLFRLDTARGILEYLDPPPLPDLYQIVEGEPGVFYMGARTHLLKYHLNAPAYFR